MVALKDGIVVRRLSPNNPKLDAETHPLQLISRKYLRTMGREAAAIHLGDGSREATIAHDLEHRDPNGWCRRDPRGGFIRREQREWRLAQR